MEVILRDHVDHVGRRGEIVKVADGYARNYLLPRKLALPATEANRKRVERERKIAEAHEAEERAAAEAIAVRLTALELSIARKVGEKLRKVQNFRRYDLVRLLRHLSGDAMGPKDDQEWYKDPEGWYRKWLGWADKQ